jgi:hypothetical protein
MEEDSGHLLAVVMEEDLGKEVGKENSGEAENTRPRPRTRRTVY